MSDIPEMSVGSSVAAQAPLDDERLAMVRELIKKKVREVVRKKAGGGGYTLYAPNKGKKGKSRTVGNFPTKQGAKRAELARFPPKDPEKLKRLRREVDRLAKDPKKAAEKEKRAAKQKGTDKGTPKPKNESTSILPDGSAFFSATIGESPFTPGGTVPTTPTSPSSSSDIARDPRSFMDRLKAIPKDNQSQRVALIQKHLSDPNFVGMLKKQQNGDQIIKQLYGVANQSAKMTPGQTKTTAEKIERKVLGMIIVKELRARLLPKNLNEALFQEERTESDWDEYISKLSKQALSGDGKFQNLQKNITKKTSSVLQDSFDMIRKSVDKGVKMKSFGIKHDANSGKTYLLFSATFEDVAVEPLYIHVEGGVPKIELSSNAKVALTKVDPGEAKLFRAELVTVQERVLDEMDDLTKAIQTRDNFLQKLEDGVDDYVSSLTPLQVSILKNLLVRKYRKT